MNRFVLAALVMALVALGGRGGAAAQEAAPVPPATPVPPSGPMAPASAPADGNARAGGSEKAAPAALSRDEREAAARALERALVAEGGLLLPVWSLELSPQLTYAHQDVSSLVAAEGGPVEAEARAHLVQSALTLRLGLPLDLQAEVEVPFAYAQRNVTLGARSRTDEELGLGDVRTSLTWQALRGAPRSPDVLLAARWKSRTGRSPYGDPTAVPLGTGLDEVGGALTIVKAVDPLVLLATFGYDRALARRTPRGRVDAGGALGLDVGAILAVSPDASILLGVEQRFTPRVRLDGAAVAGSDRTEATFKVGLSTTSSRRSSFQATLGVGLTRDVPQVQLAIATPIQF